MIAPVVVPFLLVVNMASPVNNKGEVMREIIQYILYSVISTMLFRMVLSDFVYANTNVEYQVKVEGSINVSVSSSTVNSSLNPETKTFGTEDLEISVGTNNPTGYKLFLNANDNKLTNSDYADSKFYIETLENSATSSSFPVNHWGYRISKGSTGDSSITDLTKTNFFPFSSGKLISYSYSATNNDASTLTFGSKINYDKPSGNYGLNLNFTAIPNIPITTTMQDFTMEMCEEFATLKPVELIDIRDGQKYTVRYIGNSCWMTRSLAIGCNGLGDEYGADRIARDLTSADSNLSAAWSTSKAGSLKSNTQSTDTPRMLCDSTYGGYYNLTAASGGKVISSSTNITDDICPAGWRLPKSSELSSLVSTLSNDLSLFDPVAAGYWNDMAYNDNIGVRGFYWASNYYTSGTTYFLRYRVDLGNLTIDGSGRWAGNQIRCVLK